jgi:hypothetical protein
MSLAKHHFAKLRAFHICYTCLNHALAVWCCEVINPTWCLKFCSKSVVICCSCLLVVMACSLLAFSSWFSSWACPSPPGLAADYLSFSSSVWSWASIHPHDFAVCFLVFKWCCARTCDVLGDVSLLVEWELLLLVMLIKSTAWFASSYGAASSSFPVLWLSCLCAVCLCTSLSLISSTPGHAVKLLCTLALCTPSD